MGNSKNFSNIKKLEYHYTYQIKNNINDKLYVGRHSTNNLNDGYFGSGTLLKRSIRKYGKENFSLVIMSYFDSYEECVEEERFLVNKKWCKKENTYNIVEGGSNPRMYGEDNPSWKGGISKDPSYRKTGRVYQPKGKLNPRFGYKYSNKEKLDMLLSQPNRVSFMAEGKVFKSLREYTRVTGRSRDYIKHRLNKEEYKDFFYL